MANQTLVLKDIPAAEVDKIAQKYKTLGARIEKTQQPDGNFTCRITFEDAA